MLAFASTQGLHTWQSRPLRWGLVFCGCVGQRAKSVKGDEDGLSCMEKLITRQQSRDTLTQRDPAPIARIALEWLNQLLGTRNALPERFVLPIGIAVEKKWFRSSKGLTNAGPGLSTR